MFEVRENGWSVAPFSGKSWEVRGDSEKPLLHLWSEQFSRTRRVLAITDHSEQRLALAVERFGTMAIFPGVAWQQGPSLVYLVAAALRFHPTTDQLLNCLCPELEIVRLGLAESWRRGLRVVMRH